MAMDSFLKIDGIEGESQDSKHKAEIDLESWSFGLSQPGTMGSGGGGGGGKAAFQDIHLVKKMDKSSPKLFLSCAGGDHIKKAMLVVRKAGKDQQEYLKLTLHDVLISSYQTGASDAALDNIPTEQFSLNYAKIEYSYSPKKADGTLESEVKLGWDIKKNLKV